MPFDPTTETLELQEKARDGDLCAKASFMVKKWNATHKVGSRVLYLKSEIEGNCVIKTTSEAYTINNGEITIAVIDIEAVGMVFLEKFRLAPGYV